ncbi:hypothetical protein KZJ38_22615 [Paraburkholderia edwinii]|uniref:HEPN domain-containing protein n=1 Tax=Paraburkholderia edwinii TaxID=2861782 RepID=A0ABX8V097_9BURK|nr:hypothetical protein [Paraburkholderia edwinii]QYD72518.1 hypothetical protein KZJ38_22615 [Paraburkholderia edwinii]
MPKLLDEWLNEPDTPLEKQRTVNKAQVQGWLKEAVRKYEDAGRSANSESTRMDAAYDATFFCALAALATQAVRVTSRPRHHVVALEAAAALMALPAALMDEADALREWRNRKYQGFFSATERDVADGIDTAKRYLEATSLWLRQNEPHLLK